MFGSSSGVRAYKRRSKLATVVGFLSVCALVGGSVQPVAAEAAPTVPAVAKAPVAGDFGDRAATSSDVALDGWGDAAGYHLLLGREAAGFAWREVALLRPAGRDESLWTGYQCLSGDGRYAAVAILPGSAVNHQAARDHGAFAYSVDLLDSSVHPLASGVGLKYFSPGCGAAAKAVFTLDTGADDRDTGLVQADLARGTIDFSVTVPGQVTSAVPADAGIVGVEGRQLVAVGKDGRTGPVAQVAGDAYELRPVPGGVAYLVTRAGTHTATAMLAKGGVTSSLGTGALERTHLFQGRAGGAVLAGATATDSKALSAAHVKAVSDQGLVRGGGGGGGQPRRPSTVTRSRARTRTGARTLRPCWRRGPERCSPRRALPSRRAPRARRPPTPRRRRPAWWRHRSASPNRTATPRRARWQRRRPPRLPRHRRAPCRASARTGRSCSPTPPR
ncbi:hypothetical protein [Amycolatopsis tolypomycina]|uniref:hypothetical protein n=1 Tax=Amycolatopsis tolypomycina TaxID=208445 RepID=UPI000A6447BF|nr:hypothetical protein [Amycolatopsis tolypomycina]